MADNLTIRAGSKALAIIRRQGLTPDSVSIMAGAAGGPKWLVLFGLDRIFCTEFFKRRKTPLFLIGSSIGSWRFAAYCKRDSLNALESFKEAYLHQRYSRAVPTAAEITGESFRIMDTYIGPTGIHEILSHPFMRLSALSVRSRGPLAVDKRIPLALVLGVVAAGNFISRKSLPLFFERALFYDPRDIPPFFTMSAFPTQRVAFTVENLRQAIMASGSIPVVMQGMNGIPGARPGVYRDGGMMDYHLDIPFSNSGDHIVLYPHYTDRVVPGWFDKSLPWRRPHSGNMDNVLLIAPSKDFIRRLPLKKIPDRDDFMLFRGRDDERIDYWKRVIGEGERLADEFQSLVQTGKIGEKALPMKTDHGEPPL